MATLTETIFETDSQFYLLSEAKRKSRQYANLIRVRQSCEEGVIASEILKELRIPEKIRQLEEGLSDLRRYIPNAPRQSITQYADGVELGILSFSPQTPVSDTLTGPPFETSFDEFKKSNPYHPIVRADDLIETVLSGKFEDIEPYSAMTSLFNRSTEWAYGLLNCFRC